MQARQLAGCQHKRHSSQAVLQPWDQNEQSTPVTPCSAGRDTGDSKTSEGSEESASALTWRLQQGESQGFNFNIPTMQPASWTWAAACEDTMSCNQAQPSNISGTPPPYWQGQCLPKLHFHSPFPHNLKNPLWKPPRGPQTDTPPATVSSASSELLLSCRCRLSCPPPAVCPVLLDSTPLGIMPSSTMPLLDTPLLGCCCILDWARSASSIELRAPPAGGCGGLTHIAAAESMTWSMSKTLSKQDPGHKAVVCMCYGLTCCGRDISYTWLKRACHCSGCMHTVHVLLAHFDLQPSMAKQHS